jgi:hypothetical protein
MNRKAIALLLVVLVVAVSGCLAGTTQIQRSGVNWGGESSAGGGSNPISSVFGSGSSNPGAGSPPVMPQLPGT